MLSTTRLLSITQRAIHDYILKRPFCVSFEITRGCNAKCKHCHLGGHINEHRASPERFGQLSHELNPVVVQVSGGGAVTAT